MRKFYLSRCHNACHSWLGNLLIQINAIRWLICNNISHESATCPDRDLCSASGVR